MAQFHKRLAIVGVPALMLAMAGFAQAATAEDAGKSVDQSVERTGTTMEEKSGNPTDGSLIEESTGERTGESGYFMDNTANTDSVGESGDESGNFMDDTAITAKVKAEILGDPLLKVLQIHVTTTDGVVELSGEVDSQEAMDRAEEVAEDVDDVTSVTNALVVKGAQ